MSSDSASAGDFSVAIIGAGMSGICLAIKLQQIGVKYTILEREAALGGTWHNNIYPGSGCDVPSRLYCYSFARNAEWTRTYSRQVEILSYFEDIAQRHGIVDHIRYNTEVASANFNESRGVWDIKCKDGEAITSSALVSACGQLNRPHTPDIPGRESFSGASFHSAQWDYSVELKGKNVAAIGAGASAVQYIPEIAPEVQNLHIYQRTPNWIVPKPDASISRFRQRLYRYLPFWDLFARWRVYLMLESRFPAFRKEGGAYNRMFTEVAETQLDTQVADADLRAALKPDYPIGCKRVLISDDYYPTLQRDNVSLITEQIKSIDSAGVTTADGQHHPADVIIYGTGFQTTEFLDELSITGLDNLSLSQAWADGPQAYRGVQVSGFPNFFMLYGPNTNLGHNSIIFMVEQQVKYVVKCIKTLKRRPGSYLDVRPEAQQAFSDSINERMRDTVWQGSCQSWYKNAQGHVTNNWPSTTLSFWWQLRKPRLNEMRLHPPQSPA